MEQRKEETMMEKSGGVRLTGTKGEREGEKKKGEGDARREKEGNDSEAREEKLTWKRDFGGAGELNFGQGMTGRGGCQRRWCVLKACSSLSQGVIWLL